VWLFRDIAMKETLIFIDCLQIPSDFFLFRQSIHHQHLYPVSSIIRFYCSLHTHLPSRCATLHTTWFDAKRPCFVQLDSRSRLVDPDAFTQQYIVTRLRQAWPQRGSYVKSWIQRQTKICRAGGCKRGTSNKVLLFLLHTKQTQYICSKSLYDFSLYCLYGDVLNDCDVLYLQNLYLYANYFYIFI